VGSGALRSQGGKPLGPRALRSRTFRARVRRPLRRSRRERLRESSFPPDLGSRSLPGRAGPGVDPGLPGAPGIGSDPARSGRSPEDRFPRVFLRPFRPLGMIYREEVPMPDSGGGGGTPLRNSLWNLLYRVVSSNDHSRTAWGAILRRSCLAFFKQPIDDLPSSDNDASRR